MKTWNVQFKDYYVPGKYRWSTLRSFDNPGDADNWLMNYIRENHYICSDFTIRRA